MASASTHAMQIPQSTQDLLDVVNAARGICNSGNQVFAKKVASAIMQVSPPFLQILARRIRICCLKSGDMTQPMGLAERLFRLYQNWFQFFGEDIGKDNPLGPCRRVRGTSIIQFQVEGRCDVITFTTCLQTCTQDQFMLVTRNSHGFLAMELHVKAGC